MSPSEYKTILHDTLRAISPTVLEKYANLVMASEDPEVMRKFMLLSNDTLDAGVEKKIDPNANLPIFHINFLPAGGMQGTVTPAPLPTLSLDTGAIEDIQPRATKQTPTANDKLLQELLAGNPDIFDAC